MPTRHSQYACQLAIATRQIYAVHACRVVLVKVKLLSIHTARPPSECMLYSQVTSTGASPVGVEVCKVSNFGRPLPISSCRIPQRAQAHEQGGGALRPLCDQAL